MCGIAGLFRAGGIDPAPLLGMTRSLAHRGPDDEQTALAGPEWAPFGGLGTRRLAIVDPEHGKQPVYDATGRWLLAMNGEIYNHHMLRRELVAEGVALGSQSDTDVAVNLIARIGLRAALGRMQGMFALAAIDTQTRKMWVVRDRVGVKPLYWTTLPDGTVAFGSELRAILAHPKHRRELDPRALQAFLLFEYVPTPWTPWRGIEKLPPGTWLAVDAGGARVERWWRPPLPEAGTGGNLDRWAQSLRGALEVATNQRMLADVEIGCLLSGGLDSSAVTAIAHPRASGQLRTFSVAVDAPGFDESSEARRVAAALGTQHHEVRLGPEALLELLPQISAHMDEPLADSSLVATWRLMALVQEQGIKCVLSGDGADESFAGYPTYLAHRAAPWARPLRGGLQHLAGRMRTSWEGVTRDYMVKRFTQGLDHPWARMHQVWMGAWLPEEIQGADAVWPLVDAHASDAAGADPVSRALYLDQRMYLPDGVLVKVDRASMAHGVEVRSPFLDYTMVELAASMGVGHKLHGRQTKHVLKRAVADLLPPETTRRKKQGFGTPVGPWLRGPCTHLLDNLESALEGLVDPGRVARCRDEHRAGTEDHRRRLWSAVILKGWREHWGA